ncbi:MULTISPECIES: DUF302 domain-containing protein [Haloarcula]|uniref:DUF302 domain-containing protein n=1 Tax=Haloarcula TaxID=2237 RepID=UPI0023E8BA1D|nr:DUF302 domain-containing protein [Halomicroarcula sp. SHR3]
MAYTMRQPVAADFDEAVETTRTALEDEGFGVLCDIDVQATFEEKLEETFQQYRILGACNPALAHEGLGAEPDLGALLPCNVVVYETDDGAVIVSAVDPDRLIGMTDNDALDAIAADVSDRFERVLSAIGDELAAPSEA